MSEPEGDCHQEIDRRYVWDYADRVRGMIQHENDLVNHRMTWLLTFQGILLAAYVLAWDKVPAL